MSKKHQLESMTLLHEALVRHTELARERTRSLTTKASFLAVAAGVMVTAAVTPAWTMQGWFLIAPLVSAVLALGFAASAMMPSKANEAAVPKFVSDHTDLNLTEFELRHRLTLIELPLAGDRDDSNSRMSKRITRGYIALGASGMTLVAVFLCETLLRGGVIHG